MVRVKRGEMGDKIREKLNKEQLDGVVGGGGEYDPQSWAESWQHGIVECDKCHYEFEHGWKGVIDCPKCGHEIPVASWPNLFRRITPSE